LSTILKEISEKIVFVWEGKVQNPSDAVIYNFNFLTIFLDKISLFRELDVIA
jgi:hypothetical protein